MDRWVRRNWLNLSETGPLGPKKLGALFFPQKLVVQSIRKRDLTCVNCSCVCADNIAFLMGLFARSNCLPLGTETKAILLPLGGRTFEVQGRSQGPITPGPRCGNHQHSSSDRQCFPTLVGLSISSDRQCFPTLVGPANTLAHFERKQESLPNHNHIPLPLGSR